jgi:UDP-N-acetylglucosamine--N-acetylmuramyl-(pentapeptide) pyrophosphoryl-undecaprenol N-acetylglucosamine transferase
LWQLPAAVWHSLQVMRRRRPAAVFSMGGYVAGPPMIAALLARVPVVVMEPNAMPGFTSRRFGRFVKKALLTFEESRAAFPAGVCEMTGLPVRAGFFALEPRAPDAVFRVFVTGGSRGARTLNRAVRDALASWPADVHLTLQCGPDALPEMQAAMGSQEAVAFVEDMAAAFAQSDLIVARAGAGSISELAAAGKASILVPFPFAADDHQTKNAEAMAQAGAAVLVPDAELTGVRLRDEIAALRRDPARLAAMGAAARRLARPGAAERAASILEELANLTPQRKAETIISRNVF